MYVLTTVTWDSIDSTSASNGALPQTTLQPTDTLRLTFLAQDGNEPVQPEQAMILWQPVDPRERAQPGRDHLSVVKVRKGGKARWELVRPPCSSCD